MPLLPSSIGVPPAGSRVGRALYSHASYRCEDAIQLFDAFYFTLTLFTQPLLHTWSLPSLYAFSRTCSDSMGIFGAPRPFLFTYHVQGHTAVTNSSDSSISAQIPLHYTVRQSQALLVDIICPSSTSDNNYTPLMMPLLFIATTQSSDNLDVSLPPATGPSSLEVAEAMIALSFRLLRHYRLS